MIRVNGSLKWPRRPRRGDPADTPGWYRGVKTTRYFETDILRDKRSYIRREWCEEVLGNPVHTEVQENGRIRYWGYIEEIGKYLRVVTLEDGETVHNAMPDRNFTRKRRR
jgi:hypothetical protein